MTKRKASPFQLGTQRWAEVKGRQRRAFPEVLPERRDIWSYTITVVPPSYSQHPEQQKRTQIPAPSPSSLNPQIITLTLQMFNFLLQLYQVCSRRGGRSNNQNPKQLQSTIPPCPDSHPEGECGHRSPLTADPSVQQHGCSLSRC